MWTIFSLIIIFFLVSDFSSPIFSMKSTGIMENPVLWNPMVHTWTKSSQSVDILKWTGSSLQWFTSPNIPIRLKIPKIKVNAIIEQVGLTPYGAMAIPKGRSNVAWFNLGPYPGEKGSAVIDGHYGVWKNGEKAIFNNLYKLKKGDRLYVEDIKGMSTTFVVRELRIYAQNEDASNVFTSNDGKVHLNLITCQGIWNKISKSYPNRLIVFTDKETAQ